MAIDVNYKLSLKQPGNDAVSYALKANGQQLTAVGQQLPVTISQRLTSEGDAQRLTVTLTARERVYFNLGAMAATTFATDDDLTLLMSGQPLAWGIKHAHHGERLS